MEPSQLLTFIVPAHNEAFEIAKALQSIHQAAQSTGERYEVLVVNDASTDRTVEIAREYGARVVDVNLRKISAVRNAGARAANGTVLFFVDADTQLPEATLRAALTALNGGAVGGGAWVTFAEPVPLHVHLAINLFSFCYMRLLRWAAGCFVYVRREAFEAVGGFDESLYAGEEIVLSMALKRRGRFVVLLESVWTSGRKMRMYSPWSIVPFLIRFALHGPALLRQRRGLDWWYEGKREE